jgi:K+-sensing histidine kinase KdpD
MTRAQLQTLIVWSLGAVTLLVVSVCLEPASLQLGSYLTQSVVFSLLTAFALALGLYLDRADISFAHAIGLIAFLSLDAQAYPVMTLALFIGGVVGAVGRQWIILREENRRAPRADFRYIVYTTAQVTISFYAAARVYVDMAQGHLPLDMRGSAFAWDTVGLPLAVYLLCYIALYFAIFVLHIYAEQSNWRTIASQNRLPVILLLLLPIPFALVAADVARLDVSFMYFTIVCLALTLTIFGTYMLTRAEVRQRRQFEELQSLSQATSMIRGSLNLETLISMLYTQIHDLLKIDSMTLALRSETGVLEYRLVMRKGLSVLVPQIVPDDDALVRYVMNTSSSLRLAKFLDAASPMLPMPPQAQAWMGVPLLLGQQTIGVISVITYEPQRLFTNSELRLFTIVASSASIAVENARLYSHKSSTAEQLATLNQVSALLTGTLMPGEVLDTIVTSSSMISDPAAVAVYLPSNGSASNGSKEGSLSLVRSGGLSEDFIQAAPSPLLSEKLIQGLTPSPIVTTNVEVMEPAALRHTLLKEGKRSFVELPLNIDGQVSGVIVLYYNSIKPNLTDSLDLMQAYATQAAQAVRNSRAYARADQEREQRVQQLWMLAALGRVLSAAMDAQHIYDAVLGYAIDAAHSQVGAVALIESNRLVLVAHKGADETLVQGALLSHTSLYETVMAGQMARYDDIRQQSTYSPLSPNSRSALISPIMKGREVLGAMVLEAPQVGLFTQSDSDFVQQLCYQVVTVVENTRLFQSVRETRDNLQVILNAIEEGLVLINAEGQVAMANPRVTLLGLKPEDIVNRPVIDLMQNEPLNFAQRLGFTGEETLRQMVEALHQPARWNSYPSWLYEVPDTQNVNHYVQRQIIPLRQNDGTLVGALLVFYDRTDEHELERARDSFTQMIVHDLRSPLTAVTTSMRLLQELVPPESDFRPLVQKTTDASRRALRKVLSRVDSLLDIAKIESGNLFLAREPVDLGTLIENVITELQPLAIELEVKIEVDLPPDLPLLNADGDKVERMLLNLVDNALKYSPYETSIYVRARPEPSNADMIRISVTDEGPGIPNEYKMKLFDRFMQVEGRSAVRRGVGLGLAFCKLVAETHGGSIWIEDNVPRGTRFVFTLPAWHPQPLPE